jgi:hypothetical protein
VLWLAVGLEPLGVSSDWALVDLDVVPEVWGEELVGFSEGCESGLDEVLWGSGVTSGSGVAIIDTGELQELLGDWSADNASSARSWDQLYSDGGALASDLAWDGMDVTDLVSPISSSDWDELELGNNQGALDGNLDFLGDLHSETNVTILVSDGNDSLEAGSLTGLGLLLDGDDLHDLVREWVGVVEEVVDDLVLLDWDGGSVDLLKGLDVTSLDQSSELGLWDPLVLGGTSTAATVTASAATTATAATASSETTSSSAISVTSVFSWGITCWGGLCLCLCWCFTFHRIFYI